ncbi:MAG: hypothetical protein HXS54_12070 [Theionarchaea archaeon]|nr:hypothetical protein [Theionarchaea archaeon]
MDNKNDGLEDRKMRLEIARNIFDEVLEANLHQSEISARLLIPVAFLTAAAISLFRLFVDKEVTVTVMKTDVIPILFLLYILFTMSGILVFFEVIGPSFFLENLPIPSKKQKNPKSTLFFKFIAETDIDRWIGHFCRKEQDKSEEFLEIADLQEKLIYDYIAESSLLAKKAQGKVKDNLFAHLLFYLSFCCFLLMACIGILGYLKVSEWVMFFLSVVIVHIFGYIEVQVFRKYRKEVKTYKKGLEKEVRRE